MLIEEKNKQVRKIIKKKTKKELLQEKNKNISKEEKRKTIEDLKKDLPKNNKTKKEENQGWRPEVVTPEVLQLLKLCFATWMTDEEACYQAKISTSTLYNYQKENKGFLEEKHLLKSSIKLQAKINIWRSIMKWDLENSKWWLTKMDPEFGDSLNIKGELSMDLEDEKIYQKIVNKNLKNK